MPNNQQGFDVNALKTDPKMWMRLAMPSKNGNHLENVFKDKENPFEKNTQAAVETIERLAAAGKLYLRDFGRSRHFRKVEKGDDGLKLGAKHEIKLSNNTADFGLSVLMRLSRAYFKWIGLERISNWFDGRLKRRSEIKELNSRYKDEYKSLSKEQKKELKVLRKHEKNLKKLEKIQKETEMTQRELDELQGGDSTKTKGELDAPLNRPPEIEQKENTMQPTLTGDQPVQNQTPGPEKKEDDPVQQQSTQPEDTGDKKKESQQKKSQLFIEGVELTDETAKQFPPHIVEAFKTIQQLINEAEANKLKNQQPIHEQPPTQQQPVSVPPVPPVPVPPGPQASVPPVPQTSVPPVPPVPVPPGPQTSVPPVPPVQQQVVEQPPQGQQVAEQPPQVEVPAQTEGVLIDVDEFAQQVVVNNTEVQTFDFVGPVDPKPTLQDRLAEEKRAMDSVTNWEDTIVNSLFSHAEAKEYMDHYQSIKGQPNLRFEYVSGAVFGILMKSAQDPETQQQVLDALLSGKPLGSDKNDLIRDGVGAYNHVFGQKMNGHAEPMAEMLANTLKALSRQSSREAGFTPRHLMIGRLLSNTAKIADSYNLDVPVTQEDLDLARGAKTIATVARGYLKARQYLGNEPMDITSKQGRSAVNKLLAGAYVERLIQQDQAEGNPITNTQILMGQRVWTDKNLEEMTANSATRRAMDQEQLQAILETPDSLRTFGVVQRLGDEIVAQTKKLQMQGNENLQRENAMEQQQEQPVIDLLNMTG